MLILSPLLLRWVQILHMYFSKVLDEENVMLMVHQKTFIHGLCAGVAAILW